MDDSEMLKRYWKDFTSWIKYNKRVSRCKITGRSLYQEECLSVPRKATEYVLISARALDVATPLQIAQIVLADTDGNRLKEYYSIEQVVSMIPDRCTRSVPFP